MKETYKEHTIKELSKCYYVFLKENRETINNLNKSLRNLGDVIFIEKNRKR